MHAPERAYKVHLVLQHTVYLCVSICASVARVECTRIHVDRLIGARCGPCGSLSNATQTWLVAGVGGSADVAGVKECI